MQAFVPVSPTTRQTLTSFGGHALCARRAAPISGTRMMAGDAGVRYGGIQHAGVLVKDTESSKQFYMQVLGMVDETDLRPGLPFPGAFVRAGASQIHLMELPNPDPLTGRPAHGGRDRHLAVTIQDLNPLIEALEHNSRPYTMSKSGRRALFTRDLDANAIEFIEDASL